MKKIMGLVLGLVLLTGCFGGKETTTLCKSNSDGMSMEVLLEARGDELLKSTITERIEYADHGYSDDDIKRIIDYSYPSSDGVDGVTMDVNLENGVASILIVIDYKEGDLDELLEAEWITGDADNIKFISLSQTIEEYEDIMRHTCEEQ